MSMAYCYDCLVREDECTCEDSSGTVFGDIRRAYLQGYRDAKEGREENV